MTHKVALLDAMDAQVRDEIRSELLLGCSIDAALYDAQVSGKLSGAGLDVSAMEPADAANPLFRLDQVIATPHAAGSVTDLVADIARYAFTNMQSVLSGMPLPPDDVIVAPRENK
jgi:phosphoglycerate dehydrogenase-like enzyme